MMKKGILLLLCSVMLWSCSNDDDNNSNSDIEGIWNLVRVSCECEPGNYEIGDHVWEFNSANQILTVTNNVNDDLQILDSGVYSYTLANNQITVNDLAFDYEYVDGNLVLSDHPEVDGPYIEFLRN